LQRIVAGSEILAAVEGKDAADLVGEEILRQASPFELRGAAMRSARRFDTRVLSPQMQGDLDIVAARPARSAIAPGGREQRLIDRLAGPAYVASSCDR
jgi:hypothetical protein